MSAAVLGLLVLLPALVGAGLALCGAAADRVARSLSLATAAVGLGLAVGAALTRPAVSMPFLPQAGFGLGVDALSAAVLPTIAAVTLLVLVFAAADIARSPARFHGLMLIFAAAVTLTATATTLPALLVAWEVMGATSYALIGFEWQSEERVGAGAVAFLTTRTADLGLYLAAGAALAGGSGLDLSGLAAASPGWRDVVCAGVVVAALGKAAQLPFSYWLSRAMEGPSAVSALLHSAAMVAMGGYLLLRVQPLLASTRWADVTVAWAGALTAVALGAVAVGQRDLKQLLAASTSAQLGFVVLAAGVGAVTGGTAQLVAHAATKAALFLAAGAWLSALGTKRLVALRGAARRWPLVGVAFGVAALALAGAPPLSLWATKEGVLSAAREFSAPLYAAGLVASLLSAAYAGKALFVLWGDDARPAGADRVGAGRTVPIAVLATGAATLGVLALPPLATADPVGLAVAAVIALGTLAAVHRWGVPEPDWARHWLGLERAANAVVVNPVLGLAAALARFDDRWVDGGVVAISGSTLRFADTAALADDRVVDGAVSALGRGTRALAALARRPQTGQLHQYYTQAVAVLVVAVAVLWLVS